MRNWLLLSLICLVTSVYAIKLPLYAQWQSLHSAYYDEAQTNKELSWDELYRAEFGLKNVSYKDSRFSMALDTEQFFDESHLRLKSIYFAVNKDHWVLAAGSKEHGFGMGSDSVFDTQFSMDSYPVLARGFVPCHYQNMRLNSLELEYWEDSWMASLNLGGNVHNQATAMINISKFAGPGDYLLEFHQEFRAMDNHWRTPVFISAINANYNPEYKRLWFGNSLAVSVLPEYDTTKAHHELYLQSELACQITGNSYFGAAARYQSKDYAPKELQFYQIRTLHYFKDFALIPLTELSITQGERLWQHRLLGKYHLAPKKTIGIFYEYSHFDAKNPRHTVGLELDFTVDYSATSGL